MNKSESISNLAAALVKFNSEVERIAKDSKNPHFKKTYASLDQIIDAVRPALASNGLSVMQFPGGDGEKVIMTTMLLHTSGEWIESDPLIMKPVKNDPQAVGSCITYAKRYSLAAILALNTGDDDDANQASGRGQQPQESNQQPNNQPTNLVSEAQAKAIHAKANELAKLMNTTKDSIFNSLAHENYLGPFQSVETLDKQRGSKAIKTLDDLIKQQKANQP